MTIPRMRRIGTPKPIPRPSPSLDSVGSDSASGLCVPLATAVDVLPESPDEAAAVGSTMLVCVSRDPVGLNVMVTVLGEEFERFDASVVVEVGSLGAPESVMLKKWDIKAEEDSVSSSGIPQKKKTGDMSMMELSRVQFLHRPDT